MTPADFQNRFSVDAKKLRSYLRSRWQYAHNDSWFLTPEMIDDACRHFGVANTTGRSALSVAPPSGISKVTTPTLVAPSRSASPPVRSSGLHRDLLLLAHREGIPLALGTSSSWLTGRGHLEPVVQQTAPPAVVQVLGLIHQQLGGDSAILAEKAPVELIPDLVHTELGCLIEVDEVQHFTTARARTLALYPKDTALGFDLGEYRQLVARWAHKGDNAFAHKTASDFPGPGGRQAQRAYNDAVRDLLAPTFTGHPLIRIPVPDRDLGEAVETLSQQLTTLS